VAWVIYQLDLAAFASAFSHINHAAYLAFMFIFVLVLLAADSAAIAHVYVRYVCPVRLGDVCVLRGGSYLASVVNYHAGQAWLTWFASRVYGAGLARVAGATLLNYATVFGSLALLAALAYPLGGHRIPWLGTTLLVLAGAALVYVIVLLCKPRWVTRIPGATVLFEAGVSGHLLALAWRLPHVVILFLGMWLPLSFFRISIPLADALAYVPILMLVGALPITPQGVGTRDVIALKLLAGYAPPNAAAGTVAAATLCWAVSLTLIEVILAPMFLVFARRLFQRAEQLRTAPTLVTATPTK
jgi:Lysylphosphatidylglycerol synthase TM region